MKSLIPPAELKEKLRKFYNTSHEYAEHLSREDEAYFNRYLALIERYAKNADSVLDAGCGTGLSSFLIGKKKKTVVGIDLSELFLKQRKGGEAGNGRPHFVAGDILTLPFQKDSFDLVGSYLVIEFLPDVKRGLEEMTRVLRKGGVLLIVAPNLLSLKWPLRDFFRMIRGGAARPVWCETPQAALATFWRNLLLSTRKSFQKDPEFLYREPDLTCRRVVGRDSDSVYLACPVDLVRFLRQRNFRILHNNSSTVEVVAQKV